DATQRPRTSRSIPQTAVPPAAPSFAFARAVRDAPPDSLSLRSPPALSPSLTDERARGLERVRAAATATHARTPLFPDRPTLSRGGPGRRFYAL
ncbi:hypothetical protein PRIPAC_77944, partial [Pristionchus pacificus]|uniref:Uncharacterized protein n=1 Tax=Pristionchus pacificus TaxID=54126 RepID=A0A2A6BXD1_PRIPA